MLFYPVRSDYICSNAFTRSPNRRNRGIL